MTAAVLKKSPKKQRGKKSEVSDHLCRFLADLGRELQAHEPAYSVILRTSEISILFVFYFCFVDL